MAEIDPATDLVRYLRGLGGNFTWIKIPSLDAGVTPTVFVSDLPDKPDSAMVATRYSGSPPSEVFGNPFAVRHPRVQFLIRDPDSDVALDRLVQVMKALGKERNQTINGTFYESVVTVGEPEEIGPDSSDRQRATLNMEVSFHDS